jgi:DNA repair exonuclease SbcCD ATPase subunit
MSKVRNILLDERAEVLRKAEPLTADIARLREMLSQKQAELSQWTGMLEQINSALKAVDEAEARTNKPTIMEAVLEVLKDREDDGMTAMEILAEINTRYFAGKILRSSLSPQLSRLKDRHEKIELRGNRWYRLPKEPLLFDRRI